MIELILFGVFNIKNNCYIRTKGICINVRKHSTILNMIELWAGGPVCKLGNLCAFVLIQNDFSFPTYEFFFISGAFVSLTIQSVCVPQLIYNKWMLRFHMWFSENGDTYWYHARVSLFFVIFLSSLLMTNP